ncbi:MAG TPA: FtsQ-type POTRA domain-containing protein [Patescibacteria group bacterium]|nr:FtsQ-type POTRA domain-containing protein [Patescibacteria group bacterium]
MDLIPGGAPLPAARGIAGAGALRGLTLHARGGSMPTYGDEPSSPFLRRSQDERLRRSRRRRRTLRLLPAAGLLAILAVVAGAGFGARWYLRHSPRFNVTRVALTPTDHASQGDLRRIAERARGHNIFTSDLARLEADLEQVRWVKSATVKRVLPDRILCAIEEYEPRGLALLKGRVQLIDENGTAIDVYGGSAGGWSMPIFTGLDEIRSSRERQQVARGFDLLRWVEASHPGLAEEISEIDLSHDDRIALTMNGGGPQVRLSPDDYGANLDRWLAMREWLATHFGDGAYVDLRFHDRIAFQPMQARRR